VARRDPLAYPDTLIRRVYSYVAYRLGDGPDAEDVTGDVFERALRYRQTYDSSRGEPAAWVLGIARRCVDDALRARPPAAAIEPPDEPSVEDVEADALRRLGVGAALAQLDDRGRDLIALRYGADLTARQIGELLGLTTNAVEVALHRTLAKLQTLLEPPMGADSLAVRGPAPRTSA
jgi:RNA polymerase sigma-70 factor (ECF subfamily)